MVLSQHTSSTGFVSRKFKVVNRMTSVHIAVQERFKCCGSILQRMLKPKAGIQVRKMEQMVTISIRWENKGTKSRRPVRPIRVGFVLILKSPSLVD